MIRVDKNKRFREMRRVVPNRNTKTVSGKIEKTVDLLPLSGD